MPLYKLPKWNWYYHQKDFQVNHTILLLADKTVLHEKASTKGDSLLVYAIIQQSTGYRKLAITSALCHIKLFLPIKIIVHVILKKPTCAPVIVI